MNQGIFKNEKREKKGEIKTGGLEINLSVGLPYGVAVQGGVDLFASSTDVER